MTKRRDRKPPYRDVAKRRKLHVGVGLAVVMVVGVLSAGSLAQSAPRGTGQWIVEDGSVEILGKPAAEGGMATLDRSSTLETRTDDGGSLPFLQPSATPDATAEPTQPIPEMDVLEPEATVEPETSVSITITAVGDCTLGGDVPSGSDRNFASYVKKYGYDYFFENVRALFESDDFTVVNLEGPLTTSNDKRSGRLFNFRGDPEYVNILSGSSVEVCNIANNHSLDYGQAGFDETVEVLEAAGIGASGFSQVYLTDVKGVRVCFVGLTEWAYSQETIEEMLRYARTQCDLLIVSVHWGEERVYEPLASQRKLGRAMIDAGADIVIGNHSHVYGGLELYNGKYIIYSLGNFCFGGNRNPSDKNCAIFQQTFEISLEDMSVSDGGISIIPARISSSDSTNDFQPYILTGEKGVNLVKKIAAVSHVDIGQVTWMPDGYQVSSGMVTLDN